MDGAKAKIMRSFEHKAVIATGGGGKVGQAIALTLADEGARILVSDISAAPRGETAALVRSAGGTVEPLVTDISAKANCVALVEEAIACFGWLDVVVVNAAVIFIAPLARVPADLWERTFAINVHAPFYII